MLKTSIQTCTHTHTNTSSMVSWLIFDVSRLTKGLPPIKGLQINSNQKAGAQKVALCSFCLFVWNKVCYELVVCVPAFDLNVSHDALSLVEFVLRCPSSLGLHHVCHWTLFTMKSGLCSESDGSIGKTTSKLPCLLFPSSMMRYFLRLLSPVWGTAVRLGAIHAPLPKTSGHAPLHPEH